MYQVQDEYYYRMLNLHEVINYNVKIFFQNCFFLLKIIGNNFLGASLFCSLLESLSNIFNRKVKHF